MSNAFKQAYYDRSSLSVSQNRSLEHLPEWLCTNTAHPTEPNKRWSFKDHEFQVEIVKSTSHTQSCIKCSQVGLSEVEIRKSLGIGALSHGAQIIYTLPSGSMAQMFAKTRIDPVIENSEVLSKLTDSDTDNTKLKRIGSSFLHFVGTYSASAPISVPARYVISDEIDFSNPQVLSEFASRLGHQKESESFHAKFSTPTVSGFGISASYEESSKGRYAVRCKCCEKWVMPNFLQDVVMPWTDTPIDEITKFDIAMAEKSQVMTSYLACPKCKNDLYTSLCDKDRRMWVHEYENRRQDHEGFKVVPFDVPTINPPGRTLMQMLDYKKMASWYNFKLGECFVDNTSRFDIDMVDKNTRLVDPVGATGTIMGIDVGKTQTWVSLGKAQCSYQTGEVDSLSILGLWVFDSTDSDTSLGERILKLAHDYAVSILVCDAAPDFSTAQYLSRTLMTGKAYGNYYISSSAFSKDMAYFKVDERKGVCMSDRTGTLDDLCHLSNKGMIQYPNCEEMGRVKSHLDNVKKLETEDEDARWVTRQNADDHWVHALNYLLIAAGIQGNTTSASITALAPDLRKVRMKGGEALKL